MLNIDLGSNCPLLTTVNDLCPGLTYEAKSDIDLTLD